MSERIVLDASAMVDLLLSSPLSQPVEARIRDREIHTPAHFEAEVLSAVGRLHRAGDVTEQAATEALQHLATAPLVPHYLTSLLPGAWERRDNVRLVDALYIELAADLEAPLITTDRGQAGSYAGAVLVDA